MLISVEEAQRTILKSIQPLHENVSRALRDSPGELLAVDAKADENVPPFSNSSMDGYAVRGHDVVAANADRPVVLSVVTTIRAGHPYLGSIGPGQCAKIMTGAPIPTGSDAVIPVEWTDSNAPDTTVKILKAAPVGTNIRRAGEDMPRGQVIVAKGTLITPPVVGMLATLGLADVPVMRRPRVGIVSTGDELQDIDKPLVPGRIRNSNSLALYAATRDAGGDPVLYPPAPDDPQKIRALFQTAAKECDLLVSSGGVSVGDFDFVRPVIESLGTLTLWRVNVKPGKPLAFGHVLGVPIVGLPGNPVSALVTFALFVRPVIRTFLGDHERSRPLVSLPLFRDFPTVEDRRQYVRCRLVVQDGQLWLDPHHNQGSAVQSSWTAVDSLMVVPENTGPAHRGDLVQALLLSLNHVS